MRTYERNGVHVDQCADCRGIFLDRGELERLVDAEDAWHGGTTPRRQQASQQQPYPHPQPSSAHPQQPAASLGAVVGEVMRQVRGSKSSSHSTQHYGSRRKKESFLGDLFG